MKHHDNLVFCPILLLLALAFSDNAFESIRSPQDLYKLEIPSERNCLEIRWKPEIQKTPIVRSIIRNTVAEAQPLTYHSLHSYLGQLGRSVGFSMPVTAYCLRRALMNLVDKVVTSALRNQIFEHAGRLDTIYSRHYQTDLVMCNTQSTYLQKPTNTENHATMSRMDLTRDSRAPGKLSQEDKDELEHHVDLVSLLNERERLKAYLSTKFGSIMAAQESERLRYKKLSHKIMRLRKKLRRNKQKEKTHTFFETINHKDITKQLDGEAPQHQKMDADMDVVDVDGDWRARQLFSQKPNHQKILEDMVAGLVVQQQLHPAQCIFCNPNILPSKRSHIFTRKDSMWRHVEQNHKNASWMTCPHPICDVNFETQMEFIEHAAFVHAIELPLDTFRSGS